MFYAMKEHFYIFRVDVVQALFFLPESEENWILMENLWGEVLNELWSRKVFELTHCLLGSIKLTTQHKKNSF